MQDRVERLGNNFLQADEAANSTARFLTVDREECLNLALHARLRSHSHEMQGSALLSAGCQCSILPVTALAACKNSGQTLLFCAKGRQIACYVLPSTKPVCAADVLECQAVHGVTIVSPDDCSSENQIDALVYGGQYLAWIRLNLRSSNAVKEPATLKVIQRIKVADWILCGRSFAGSRNSAILITSYNALFRLSIDPYTDKLDLNFLCSDISTFIYSADIVQVNEHCFIVASGTALGELLTWLCIFHSSTRKWKAVPWRDYRGHKGSIFGVSISNRFSATRELSCRLLASSSDDRTIIIWDLSEIESEAMLLAQSKVRIEDVPGRSFKLSQEILASRWAHQSRIWQVDFVKGESMESPEELMMFTAGEDGQIQSWTLDYDHLSPNHGQNIAGLHCQHIDRHHAGKNIWSACCLKTTDGAAVFTGGADGRIVSRSYGRAGLAQTRSLSIAQTFRNINISGTDRGSLAGKVALKSYVIVSSGEVVATTDSGVLLRWSAFQSNFTWSTLYRANSKSLILLSSRFTTNGILFFHDSSVGRLFALDLSDNSVNEVWQMKPHEVSWISILDGGNNIACVAVKTYDTEKLQLLWVSLGTKAAPTAVSEVLLPKTFDVSSVEYNANRRILICGSRAGAIVAYRDVSSSTRQISPTICQRRIHGEDTVTSLTMLREVDHASSAASYCLSTGRNGKYCILKLDLEPPASGIGNGLRIVHEAEPPLGPQIEGANIVSMSDGCQRLMLYGFRSKDFVVWDETRQTTIMSVDCGGAHRSWAFNLNSENPEAPTFVWTKAGTFMYHSQGELAHRIIQPGGHGREIKALAVRRLNDIDWLIATGSEDTDIRLFKVSPQDSDRSAIENLAVIRKHTTGLQDLHFLADGKTLISAAGMEELYAWTLSAVPMIGQGVAFSGGLPRTDALSDARIMSLSSHPDTSCAEESSYILAAVLSSGKVRVIKYSAEVAPHDEPFTMLREIDLGTVCLTQATVLSYGDSGCIDILVGATNGCLTNCQLSLGSEEDDGSHAGAPGSVQRVHQNNISALQVVPLTTSHNLVITGGDDNGLAITVRSPANAPVRTSRSLNIPKAHAAAITALSIIDVSDSLLCPRSTCFVLISASNDQRLCLWSIALDDMWCRDMRTGEDGQSDESKQDMSATSPSSQALDLGDTLQMIKVRFLDEQYTNVADISGMALLRSWVTNNTVEAEVCIAGVGIEILRFKMDYTSTREAPL